MTESTSRKPDTEIRELLDRWAAAELKGDTSALAAILDPGFKGIGPVGFVLDSSQWINRHHGNLENRRFDVVDVAVRCYGPVAVADAVVVQETTAMGRDTSGSFRLGVVAVPQDQGWVLAQVQFSGPLIEEGQVPDFARNQVRG